MSHRHEGISCDFCHKSGFTLRRYKCLLCFDYDLCGSCFDNKRESNNHRIDHPMQCLITKDDYGAFYAGENHTNLAFSYTCPICGKLGNTVVSLHQHINKEHSDSNIEVICPICASLSDGNANQQTRNLYYHITSKHSSYLNEQDDSPKSSRRLSKNNRNLNEAPNTNKIKKTILPGTSETYTSSQALNPNIFTSSEHSFGNADEPLLHTLLNHLYTWSTKRESATLNRHQSVPDSRTTQEIEGSNLLNEENVSLGQSEAVSRSSIKQSLQERSKTFRRKFGTRHIIDLTGENWRLVDPDNDLFSFDDEDLESISLSLNQAPVHPNEVDDSEYLDEDDDMAPWTQDISAETMYNQLKLGSDSKTGLTNNSFIKSNLSSNNYYKNKIHTKLDDFEFKLPQGYKEPKFCELTIDDKLISVNVSELIGSQGLLAKDAEESFRKEEEQKNKTSNERCRYIRDILLSTIYNKVPKLKQSDELK